MAIMSALLIMILCGCNQSAPETVKATSKEYARDIIGYGTISVSESDFVVVEKGSVIQSVNVEVGESVNEGDLLFTVVQLGTTTEVTAKCGGIVSEIQPNGTRSDGKSPLCVITKTDSLSLSVLVNEKDIAAVKTGDPVTVSGDGFGNADCQATVGRRLSIPQQSGMAIYYPVRIDLPENVDGLLPGMSAKAVIHSVSEEKGIILPFTSVGFDKSGYYVYLSDGKRVDLTSAIACNDGYAVEGIEEGSQVFKSISEVEE